MEENNIKVTVLQKTSDREIFLDFGQKPKNRLARYTPFANIKAYIDNLPIHMKWKGTTKVIAERMSCSLQLVNQKWELWNSLTEPVPLKYFEAIEADIEEIKRLLVLDQQAYDEALDETSRRSPKYFLWKAMPTVWIRQELPEGATEAEAIAYVKSTHRGSGVIPWTGIKEIWVSPGEKSHTRYFWPDIKIENGCAVFSYDGEKNFTLSIK